MGENVDENLQHTVLFMAHAWLDARQMVITEGEEEDVNLTKELISESVSLLCQHKAMGLDPASLLPLLFQCNWGVYTSKLAAWPAP